ncbi:unnamed protein product [Closterium sp. Naga37s-1]|nr:unnamed protein product [Closterium sp. Naga37s-1]
MIRNVRACKTAAEERGVIAKECANLRTAFKENDIEYRHRNVAKLMFIHMLGYPTHFGQMECLKLIASPGFPEKRIGYLGLMVLLDERQEVLMLVTNSLKNDLNHTNQFIIGLALCALGNICSSEMARDLAPEVERLLNSNNSYIRKKAALCSVRIIRKVPDLAEYLLGPASGLLQDKHHGVLLSGTKLAIQLCDTHPPALDYFRKQVPTLVRILKNLVVSGYAPEYDVGGITDPFLQIRVLRLLRMLGKGDPDASDIMSDILAQVATNTEANKNTGNAILYECVHTIFGVEAIGGLRVLAINILGRFLANRDNNIRYVALHTLIKVVAVDTQAVQRHRNTIVECVKDSDISIRRRALELVCALVNEGNLKALTRELLDYLRAADSDFKPDLTSKICALVQRYAPSKLYHVEIMLRVMTEAGEYVTDDVIRFLVVLISNAPELQGFAVRSFFHAMRSWKGQESLGVVTVWCLGEYGEMLVNNTGLLQGETPLQVAEAEVVQMLEGIMKDTRATPTLKAYVLVALLKLSCRFPSCSQRIKWLEEQHRHSLVLELQQRSVEFSAVLARHDKIKATLADKMPALDEVAYRSKRADLAPDAAARAAAPTGQPSANGAAAAGGAVGGVRAAAPQAQAQVLADLLDLTADDSSAAPAAAAAAPAAAAGGLLDLLGGVSAPAAVATSAPAAGGADLLLDLLSLGDAPAPPAAAAAPAAMPAAAMDPLAGLMGGAAPTLITPTPAAAPFAPAAAPAAAVDPFGGFAAAPAAAAAPAFPGIVALESRGLRITFEFAKDPAAPQSTTISATYTNSSPSPLTDFVFQAAVPKFMQLQLEAASGAAVPASNSGSVTQTMRITNTLHGQKPLVMKLRVSYKVGGQDVLEQGQGSGAGRTRVATCRKYHLPSSSSHPVRPLPPCSLAARIRRLSASPFPLHPFPPTPSPRPFPTPPRPHPSPRASPQAAVRALVVALLAVAMAGGAAEARPEGFGRWFVVPALDGEGSFAGACGPRVAGETPACNVSGRSKGHELRSYPDDEVREEKGRVRLGERKEMIGRGKKWGVGREGIEGEGMVWVTTIVVNASYDKAVEDGTWRLHSFFAGHNARSEPIALTAPVLTMPRPEAAGYEVSLVVPRRYSPESVPQPTDPTVKLVLMPRGVVRAVLGPFGGFPTEAVYGSKLQRLKGLLERRGMGFDESSGSTVTFVMGDLLAKQGQSTNSWWRTTTCVLHVVPRSALWSSPNLTPSSVPFPSPRHRIALVKSPTLPSSPPFPSHPSNATGTPTLSAMVLKTELCRFSGAKIYPGRGIRFIRADSQVFLFVNAKCKQYFHNRLKPSKLDWTAIYRKQHKKDVQAEGVRRKKRTATKVHSRSIVGASLEVIQKRRSEKAEVRAAARDAALREIKERLKKVKDEKKAKKAEVTTKQAKAATKAAAPRASGPKGGKVASLHHAATMALVANEGFQHILRVLNTNVDGRTKIMYALTSIRGIGRRFANIVCKKADVDLNKRAGELSAAELENLMVIVGNPRQFKIPDWFLNRQKDYKDGRYSQVVSNGLDMKMRDDLERLKKIRNHRGLRHYWGLRVRGQHTKTTGRRGRTVGVSKKR